MQQKKINISRSSQSEIFGDKNQNLDSLKTNYPKLKLILRDEDLNVIGDDKNVKIFLESWSMIENHYSKFGSFFKNLLPSIGDSVSATNEDTITEKDSAIAVSLNNVPAIPSIKIKGRKTATKINVVAMIAKLICLEPLYAATKGLSPFSTLL